MARPIYAQALDAAALILSTVIGVPVAVNPKSAIDPEELDEGVLMVAAVAKGASQTLNELLGAPRFEIEHPARFTLFAFHGEEADQDAAIEAAQIAAAEALAADSTLGGLVADCSLGSPTDDLIPAADTVSGAAITLPLIFLYTAASAAG